MNKLVVVAVLVALCIAGARAAGPSDFFSAKDASEQISAMKSVQDKKTGAFGSGIQDTAFAVDTLVQLGAEVPQKDLVCKYAEKALEGDVDSAYHAFQVLQALKCLKSKLADAPVKALTAALSDSNIVKKMKAAIVLGTLRKAELAAVDRSKLAAVITDIANALDQADGSIKVKGANEGSAFNAAIAYEALAALWSYAEKEAQKDKVVKVVAAFENLVDSADETSQQLSFSHTDNSVSNVRATGQVVRSIVALSKTMETAFNGVFDDSKVAKVAAYLVNNKNAGSIADVNAVVSGLKALASGAFFKKPLVLSLTQNVVSGSAASAKKDDLAVRVTDLFGKAGPQARVLLTRAYPVGADSTPLITNQELTAAGDIYKFNFIGAKPEAGQYNAEFRVTLPKEATAQWLNVDTATRTIKVVSSVEVADAEVVVSATRDADKGNKIELGEPSSRLKKEIVVSAGSNLFVSFRLKNKVSGKPMTVQQAFVLFSDASATGDKAAEEDIFFVVPVDTQRKMYRLNIDLSKFKNRSGKYNLRILIGDPSIDNSFEWNAATIALEFKGAAQAAAPSPFIPKPVIEHKFRVPDKRAPAFLSSVFTLAVLAPLAVLLIGSLVVGLNFSYYPGGVDSMSALAFHGCMVAFFGVYVWYWLALDIFEVLTYSAVVAVPLVFFGHRTLRAVYVNRHKQQ